jgi:hypothetical protein
MRFLTCNLIAASDYKPDTKAGRIAYKIFTVMKMIQVVLVQIISFLYKVTIAAACIVIIIVCGDYITNIRPLIIDAASTSGIAGDLAAKRMADREATILQIKESLKKSITPPYRNND